MILDKFKRLLIFLLFTSSWLWAEPVGASEKSSGELSDFAIFLGPWTGTTTGTATEYLDVKMSGGFIIDSEIQIARGAIGFYYGFGLIHCPVYLYGEDGCNAESGHDYVDDSWGFTYGYAVFALYNAELQPFIGLGGNSFDNFPDDMNLTTFVMGANIDIRLGSKRVKSTDVAFELGPMIRLKYIAELGLFSDERKKVKYEGYYINHVFALNLGIAIW